jgi:hypothetical protein
MTRALQRFVSARLEPLSAWASATYPMVWRTRVLLWTGIGVAASPLAAMYGSTVAIARETLPSLSTIVLWLPVCEFLIYAGLVLVIVDIGRRTAPIVELNRGLIVLVFMFVSCIALAMPPYFFVRSVVPRIADLESGPRLTELLQFHGGNRFWRCWPNDGSLSKAFEAHREIVERDLLRYGVRSRASVAPYVYVFDCGDSLYVVGVGATRRSGRELEGFEGRLRHIDAAQRYGRSLGGPYQNALSPFQIPVAVVVAASAAVAMILSSPLLLRTRTVERARHSFQLQWWTHPRSTTHLGERIASRWPMLWSTRAHALAGWLVILCVVTAVFFQSVDTQWSVGLLAAVVGFGALRTQHVVRHLRRPSNNEVLVLIVHAVMCTAAIILVALLTVGRQWTQSDYMMLASWALMLSGVLHAARNASVYNAYAALLVGFAGLVSLTYAIEWLMPRGIPGQQVEFSLLTVGTVAIQIAAWRAVERLDAQPSLQRSAVAMVVLLVPVTSIMLTLALFGNPFRLGARHAALTIGTTAVALKTWLDLLDYVRSR